MFVIFAPNSPRDGFLLNDGPVLEDSARSLPSPGTANAELVRETFRICDSPGVDEADAGDLVAVDVK